MAAGRALEKVGLSVMGTIRRIWGVDGEGARRIAHALSHSTPVQCVGRSVHPWGWSCSQTRDVKAALKVR